jgi:phosphoribosylamine---glycine ligase
LQVTENHVLLIGSGGREHALAWKIAQSSLLGKLYAAPGNPGIGRHAECVGLDIGDHIGVIEFCRQKSIGLVVIGPEAPLVAGMVDDLKDAGIAAFGPTKSAARLEGSKGFAKDICRLKDIPTARYSRVASKSQALSTLEEEGLPIVIKADGLAGGKGVTVAFTRGEALAAIGAIFDAGGEGEAVIEEYLEGEEASFFALVDGSHAVPLATAQDYKRVGEHDTGANTGGMGAYSPAAVMTEELCRQTMREIIEPTLVAMEELGSPYQGVLYAGLMITREGPKLIEYNARFGDPECQVLMMRLESDLLSLLKDAVAGRLDLVKLRWKDEAALSVVMASRGYPGAFQTGSEIKEIEAASRVEGVQVFHAGTAQRGSRLIANGGRVLNVTALGKTVREAQERAYRAVSLIDWPQGFYRKDIGFREVERERKRQEGAG